MRDWYPALPSISRLRMLQRRIGHIKTILKKTHNDKNTNSNSSKIDDNNSNSNTTSNTNSNTASNTDSNTASNTDTNV